MRAKHLLLVTQLILLLSCHKQMGHPGPSPVVTPPPPAVIPPLNLKDINIRSLPSPYYHFEYNDTGNITIVDYQSGLRIYDVRYSGKNIASMENTSNPNNRVRLEYEYANGDLLAVTVKDNNGVIIRHCILSYSASHQLQQLDWEVRESNGAFAFEQTLLFTYYPDGNVKEIKTHDFPIGPQAEANYKDNFENYDDKVNADGFSLLHTITHELILAPATKLQINNARRNVRTGDGINYEVDYTYTYDAKGRPLVKTGDLTLTNGASSGQHVDLLTTFSYYD